jgi:hypothetical protein
MQGTNDKGAITPDLTSWKLRSVLFDCNPSLTQWIERVLQSVMDCAYLWKRQEKTQVTKVQSNIEMAYFHNLKYQKCN